MTSAQQRLAVLLATAVMAGSLNAQAIEYKGTTMGCFYVSVPCTPLSTTKDAYLTFIGNSFDKLTTAKGTTTINNLGWLRLGLRDHDYTGSNFLLQVLFELPTLADPTAVYSAALLGDVQDSEGGVNVHFGSSPVFYFNGPEYAGSFTLSIADINAAPGEGRVAVSGFIKTTVTPEPATLALMATGLAGFIPALRRRKRNANM